MLNLVHLKVLAAVARHGSVTEAATELHYSQPSVSHHLSRLEAATGVKLARPRPHRRQPNLAEQPDETGGDQRAA
jgi:DNA-binding transcriptional LysR family regulator